MNIEVYFHLHVFSSNPGAHFCTQAKQCHPTVTPQFTQCLPDITKIPNQRC